MSGEMSGDSKGANPNSNNHGASTKTDAFVKLVLIFFISLLSFSIGTFVGKKFSDNQHQLSQMEPTGQTVHEPENEEAAVAADKHDEHHDEEKKEEHLSKTEPAKSEHALAKSAKHESVKSEGLSDEEIAKLAEEFVADDQEAPKKLESGKHEETKHSVEPKSTSAEKHKNATKSEEDERAPTSISKNAAQYSVGKYTLQVASYSKESEAKTLAENLKKKGLSAYYVSAEIKGTTWYRVSVGQFANSNEAKIFQTELVEKSKMPNAQNAIVTKIAN